MRGFTLVELSIVIVVIGLLVGGVVSGQSLIRASEVSSVITEVNEYTSAVNNFKQQYSALPGDFKTATDYWGTAATCPGTDANPSTDNRTCDGNGNGFIGNTVGTRNERHRFWQHLSAAQLIGGSYTGVQSAGSTTHITSGVNVPESDLTNAGYGILTSTDGNATTFFREDLSRHMMKLAQYNNQNISNGSSVLTTKEAKSVDRKMDDELPGYGKVRSQKNTCATTAVEATAVYNVGLADIRCVLLFNMGF